LSRFDDRHVVRPGTDHAGDVIELEDLGAEGDAPSAAQAPSFGRLTLHSTPAVGRRRVTTSGDISCGVSDFSRGDMTELEEVRAACVT
jgi:hypothetical protein